jgi:class 3 adenylate cyclase
MAGFTAISERLGEEGTFALIQPIYELMAGAVRELGGSVKDFTGDGVMALFGVPYALEDAPLRACRAGLLIHERLAAAAPAIQAEHGVQPQLRVGVNSGLAVVTRLHGESGPVTAIGDTVNLASRLQTLAEPGAVYLSEATQRLVLGLVETTFVGAHAIKGKTELQRVYRLDSIRHGATRFEAALGRGLTAYVGRELEMEVLERALAEARSELRVIDVVADPGMGKSRLLHEFRRRIDREQAFILTGSCSPDGQQTPFLPFIEVVRESFQVRLGETEVEVGRKLEVGLTVLGLHSQENLGLLLNLLGLKPQEGALAGLDGVLIGLRTRALLRRLVEARSGPSPAVLLIEDLHCIDSVSQEILGAIIDGETSLQLLILHTRRPEYEPPWRDRSVVTTLQMEPLAAGEIRRLVKAWFVVEAPPEALVRLVTEKAEGNALFAEEILSFLTERGVLRAEGGRVEFDAGAVGAALPASVQSLLTARIDRLAPRDRALLQAAAVIGRRFDPQLLAAAANVSADVDAGLVAMHILGLVRPQAESGGYSFKHALVRDALYQSLLTGPRAALHLKIAEEIERRSGNGLSGVVETLAHHYSQTDRADKAFAYLSMAGAKCLGVYSLGEADQFLTGAIALLERNPGCTSDEGVAQLLVDYTLCSNLEARFKAVTEIVARFMSRLDRLGNNPRRVLVSHHFVCALLWSGRYREALAAQTNLSTMAAGLSDAKSRAYALASAILVSTIIAPGAVEVFEAVAREARMAASNVDDAYLQCFLRFVVGWEDAHRGRAAKAHEAAQELMAVGRQMNDPRSIGFGMQLKAWVAYMHEDFDTALNLAETAISVARTPLDRTSAMQARFAALVLLKRPEALPMLRDWMHQCAANGWWYLITAGDAFYGVALVLNGETSAGIRWLEEVISRREDEGYRASADQARGFLAEIYLEIISRKKGARRTIQARDFFMVAAVMLTAKKRVTSLMAQVRGNPRYDPNGQHVGRSEMVVGLLYKAKKKRALAIQHLTEARRIMSQSGPTPILARIDAALAEFGVSKG